MIAEILSTGDELRSGAIVDSNSAHIAGILEAAGVCVSRHQCVGDDMDALAAVMREIGTRADVAVVTGGLGPTMDDLTAEAAARAAGVATGLNRTAFGYVEKYFSSRNRPMPESSRKQAVLPENAEVMENPVGTAPGFAVTIGKCRFFFMPGVPSEMYRMLAEQVMPRIIKIQGPEHGVIRSRTISTFGLPESVAGERIAGLSDIFPVIQPGLRAVFPEIQVKLYGKAKDEATLVREMDAATAWVLERLGDKVFSLSGRTMEEVTGALLKEKKATVAVAESCTGGLIASMLTDISGSSDYFLFGGVTYSNEAKFRVLGVLPETLEKYGAVSEETVREMAEGVRRVAGADYGLSTSGIAGPTGGTPDKPVGTVCIGLAGPSGISSRRFNYRFSTRAMHKSIFAMTALDMLRRELSGKNEK